MDYNHIIQHYIIPQLKIIESKKQEIPQNMLGRMLAYSCFMPRLSDIAYLYENFRCMEKDDFIFAHKGLCISPSDVSKLLQDCNVLHKALNDDLNNETLCVLLDSVDTYIPFYASRDNFLTSNKNSSNSTISNSPSATINTNSSLEEYTLPDCIGILRRLSSAFIAQGGVILDSYQILESAIAGADMVIIDVTLLRSYALFACLIKEGLADISSLDLASDDIFSNHARLDSNIINKVLSIPINPKNYKHKNILLDNLNNLISLATNLGLVPIIRIQAKEDLALLLGLKQAIDCVIVPTNLISLLPNSYLIFSYASYFNDKNLNNTNVDLEMNSKFKQFCLDNPGVDMVIESIVN
ncbi:hypothetical protein LS73_004675 [Helicobacter muridarum]|uniref:Indole-3-glycerol-phosphate synthase n=1 Tax=Helicobacter muridarum TaxID=216 RepID=A0A099TZK6_9HELI|nr:hypothetical protein [Helicobacter muridarum]TLE00480.1 hypothetical protein LS73_004675 [Helicobacter muridarum]STQ86456.1 Uncharacterised protein [Helicobacter muridarum]